MKDVQIILLNGPTCAGKSTIARLAQAQLRVPYVHMQIDAFLAMLPARYMHQPSPDDRAMVKRRLRSGFHQAIASMVREGNHVIVDTVMADPSWLDEWLDAFAPFEVLTVGVFARLEDLRRREARRRRYDDIPGTAEKQFHTVHEDVLYDVRLDSSADSLEHCADALIARLRSDTEPTAFREMKERRMRPRVFSSGLHEYSNSLRPRTVTTATLPMKESEQ